MGVGQFCTQPGLILVMEGGKTDDFIEALEIALSKTEQQCMIHPNLKQNYIQDGTLLNSPIQYTDTSTYRAWLESGLKSHKENKQAPKGYAF